jgi:hypothetical protein
MKKITFPVSQHISPGHKQFRFQESVEHEKWHMGFLISTTTEVIDGIIGADVPDPGEGNRGTFQVLDRTFTVIRDDDEDFWGTGGRNVWLDNLREKSRRDIATLAAQFGWDLDENGMPLPPSAVFSISEMQAEGKTLMAHIMAELKIFPSVGQARKNGWDKPLVVGDYTVTKKKIRFKVIE